MLDFSTKGFNRYKINKEPHLNDGEVFALLNLSRKQNLSSLLEYSIECATNKGQELTCVYIDWQKNMSESDAAQLSEFVKSKTEKLGFNQEVDLIIERKSLPEIVESTFQNAALIVCDSGFSNAEKKWRHHIARSVNCQMTRVEKKRSLRLFSLNNIIHGAEQERISIKELMHWIRKTEGLYSN